MADIETKKVDLQKTFREQEIDRISEDFDEQQKMLQAQFAKGEINRQKLNESTRDNQLARAEAERQQLEKSLSLLSQTDKDGREKILAQLAEIETRKAEIIGTYQDQEFSRISEATDKALKAVEDVELS